MLVLRHFMEYQRADRPGGTYSPRVTNPPTFAASLP